MDDNLAGGGILEMLKHFETPATEADKPTSI